MNFCSNFIVQFIVREICQSENKLSAAHYILKFQNIYIIAPLFKMSPSSLGDNHNIKPHVTFSMAKNILNKLLSSEKLAAC